MCRVEPDQDEPKIFSTVTLNDLTFNTSSKMQEKTFKQSKWRFLCTATFGSTLLCSDVNFDAASEVLKCEKNFRFPKNCDDTDVEVSLYVMVLDKKVRFGLLIEFIQAILNFNFIVF